MDRNRAVWTADGPRFGDYADLESGLSAEAIQQIGADDTVLISGTPA
jgi:hypothetical protein